MPELDKTYFLVFVRPVGSNCWTQERIATTHDMAKRYAAEEQARVLKFHDGTTHRQSTAIVQVALPAALDTEQQSYDLT